MKIAEIELSRTTAKQTARKKIVAAIPCYNTESTISEVVRGARKYVNEVFVIDDGSTDLTAVVARSSGAKVIKHGINRGYGEAIKSCINVAKNSNCDILVIIDGDGQHDPDEIPNLLSAISAEEAELVIGSRFVANGHDVPMYRKFGINVINFLWNFGSNVKISDTQSGFRAFTKPVLHDIRCNDSGMSVSIEIIEEAREKGIKIKEVPITCQYENNNSVISTKAFRHGLGVALSVLQIRLEHELDFMGKKRLLKRQRVNN
jgi:glycosyltransferase involved in cell wall biosynthesis